MCFALSKSCVRLNQPVELWGRESKCMISYLSRTTAECFCSVSWGLNCSGSNWALTVVPKVSWHGGSWICQRCCSCCAWFLGLRSGGLYWHYLYGENSISVLESAEATCWKLCFCLCPVWETRAGVLTTRVAVSSHEPQTFALDYGHKIIIVSCDKLFKCLIKFRTLSLNFVGLLCMCCCLSCCRTLEHLPISANPRWMAVVSSSEPWLFMAALPSTLENSMDVAECLAFYWQIYTGIKYLRHKEQHSSSGQRLSRCVFSPSLFVLIIPSILFWLLLSSKLMFSGNLLWKCAFFLLAVINTN